MNALQLPHPGVQACRGRLEQRLNLGHAAKLLKIAPKTLRLAAEAGEIDSIHPLPDDRWIFDQPG
ncbi:hypothetical protein ACVWXN_005907 [Bradyrhizobium sp. i1.4.4]|uniref:hypothetical protein n=1 Tax=Bradyrhizobium sp. I1.7.5 TaxID=3156363 RepID=UPI003390F117